MVKQDTCNIFVTLDVQSENQKLNGLVATGKQFAKEFWDLVEEQGMGECHWPWTLQPREEEHIYSVTCLKARQSDQSALTEAHRRLVTCSEYDSKPPRNRRVRT